MSTTPKLLKPEEQVLSTLRNDGSRRWLKPRLSHGWFLIFRRLVAYLLIAAFTVVPYIKFEGKPLILLDVAHREFTIFGYTFLPTDTILLALLLVSTILGVFLLTALFGRLWCGWACPQTVYMEFVFRPIERLFEGTGGRGGKPKRQVAGWRQVLRFVIYLLVSMYLAHTFLAYFVGVDNLRQWVQQSPLEHPTSFLIMMSVTALMMFDFCFFREQLCIIACPYGRLQSVMLDKFSLIVSYDEKRGDPRGPVRKKTGGDCVDCGQCVSTCPTGIDIRKGLQMECIGCAQCIDVCNKVMTKVGRAKGLIRYSSQHTMAGNKRRLIRPRVLIYPLLLAVVFGIFLNLLMNKDSADVTILRNFGAPFTVASDEIVDNNMRLRITNRSEEDAAYMIRVLNGDTELEFVIRENPIKIAAGKNLTEGVLIHVPRTAFKDGILDVLIDVNDGKAFQKQVPCRLLGPAD